MSHQKLSNPEGDDLIHQIKPKSRRRRRKKGEGGVPQEAAVCCAGAASRSINQSISACMARFTNCRPKNGDAPYPPPPAFRGRFPRPSFLPRSTNRSCYSAADVAERGNIDTVLLDSVATVAMGLSILGEIK